MSLRLLYRRLAKKVHRLKHRAGALYEMAAMWSDTPQGRLTRWAVGILVALATIAASRFTG
ncbi:hypothetical protein [Streptomyces pseudovenezuelae]|uniref:hypothetical protein n=1 Tax=Streptomyces pseudovenezuelae TaxID=67350 RepID=UPI00371443CE